MSTSKIHLNKLLQRTTRSSQQTEDVKQFIYTRSKWSDKEVDFTFLVAAENKCYKSHMTIEEFKSQAAELDKNYEEFYEDCKKALTASISLPGYDYEIDSEELLFKLIQCEGYETVNLELNLREVSNNASIDMLDTSIELLNEQAEQGKANTVDPIFVQEYEKYIKESKELQEMMLKKFMLLLNTKKAKIRELQEEIKSLKSRQNEETSSEEDEMGQDTDLENEADAANATIYEGVTQAMTPPRTESTNERKRTHTDDEQPSTSAAATKMNTT